MEQVSNLEYRRAYYAANKERLQAKAREDAKRWRERHPEKKKASARSYYLAHRQEVIAKPKAWEVANMARKRARNRVALLGRYGITLEQHEQMLRSQDGRCDICKRKFKDSRNTHTDHDHATGKVRSLLCTRCNNGLGHVERDGGQWVKLAMKYIKKHRSADAADDNKQLSFSALERVPKAKK